MKKLRHCHPMYRFRAGNGSAGHGSKGRMGQFTLTRVGCKYSKYIEVSIRMTGKREQVELFRLKGLNA